MASTFEKYIVDDDGDGAGFGTTAYPYEAQTFTIGTVGENLTFNISSVDVKIGYEVSADDDVDVMITEVLPDGSPDLNNVLSTGTILSTAMSTTHKWMNATMTTAALKASTKYALIIGSTGWNAGGTMEWREDASSPAYTGGTNWGDGAPAWIEDATADKMFQINGGDYAGTLCTLADARNKGGVNASANSTNESLVSDYVRQAEGVINAITRFDWVTAYAGLTDEVKFILNQVASDLAAIYIITYDMSGYTADTVEAETMLNIYRESVKRGLSLLEDQNVKKFITGDT